MYLLVRAYCEICSDFFGKNKGRKNWVDYIALTTLTRVTTLYINYIWEIYALTNVDKR